MMFPKPTPHPKKPRKPLRAKRRRRPRKEPVPFAHPKPTRPEKTKHGRRDREGGFMAFCHARGCEMRLDTDLQRTLNISHLRCVGRREFAHLHDRRRYAPGDIGAVLCEAIHEGIDGEMGGKARWYVQTGRVGQHAIRMRLANRARAAWDALTPEERAAWDARAAADRAGWRRRAQPT